MERRAPRPSTQIQKTEQQNESPQIPAVLTPELKKPTHWAVWWAENEPVSDGGNPPRPIRPFRMTEHGTPDLFASRVPVHSALVQKSVTTITNLVGSAFQIRC
jgi:hypothetical protein